MFNINSFVYYLFGKKLNPVAFVLWVFSCCCFHKANLLKFFFDKGCYLVYVLFSIYFISQLCPDIMYQNKLFAILLVHTSMLQEFHASYLIFSFQNSVESCIWSVKGLLYQSLFLSFLCHSENWLLDTLSTVIFISKSDISFYTNIAFEMVDKLKRFNICLTWIKSTIFKSFRFFVC